MPKPTIPVINWNNPITRGMIFNTPMIEAGGNTFKDIVQKRTATIFFDAANVATFANSPFGNVLSLDGSDYATTSPIFDYTSLGTNFTIAQWVNITNLANLQVFTTFNNAIMINVSASDWRWQQDEGTFSNVGCTATRLANVWYFYVVTKAGTGAGQTKLYLNGVQNDNGNAVVDPTSGGITIGRQAGASPRSLVGKTLGPIIWNRVLLPTEIKQLYTNPWQIYVQPKFLPPLNSLPVVISPFQTFKTLSGAGNI